VGGGEGATRPGSDPGEEAPIRFGGGNSGSKDRRSQRRVKMKNIGKKNNHSKRKGGGRIRVFFVIPMTPPFRPWRMSKRRSER